MKYYCGLTDWLEHTIQRLHSENFSYWVIFRDFLNGGISCFGPRPNVWKMEKNTSFNPKGSCILFCIKLFYGQHQEYLTTMETKFGTNLSCL